MCRVALFFILACICEPAFGARPLTVNDTASLDWQQWQVEIGIGYRQDLGSEHFDFPFALTYGLVPGLEIGAGFGGQIDERAETENKTIREIGLGDLMLGTKLELVSEHGWLPAQALSPLVKIPTADAEKGLGSGEIDYDLTWIASKVIGKKANAHINVGYTWVGDPPSEDLRDIFHYGLAVDYQLVETLQLEGEVFAQKDGATVWQYNVGLRWDTADDMMFDMALGSTFSGEGPHFTATMGLTWVFGFESR
ncbi:MAG: hypothetical protein A2283_05260 [Lentisphaerae bacterium RIFOXYA12_FULL_48_11]|nr:MAG: hypothetical protein A2283_05260 [Lentisphaerae bacterium RIFOXYA12_FULL_48_11]